MTEAELRAAVLRLFPAAGPRVTLELGSGGEYAVDFRGDGLWAVIRVVVHDADGSRDLREEPLRLLPARHLNARGVAFLEYVTGAAAALSQIELEHAVPHELFDPSILDVPGLPIEAFGDALAEPRTRQILATRPYDTELMATIDPRRPRPPALVNPELEERIVERLDDDAASKPLYEVYGDWLSERGDPRGELIAIQLALEGTPGDMALVDREAALLDDYTYEWLRDFAWQSESVVAVEWRRGFVHAVRFGLERYDHSLPSHGEARTELAQLARLSGTRFLRRVELMRKAHVDAFVFEAIGEIGLPPSTVELAVASELLPRGNVAPAYRALARLRALRLELSAMELGAIDLPELHKLELLSRGLTRANLVSLRAASWPHLERLELWLGDPEADTGDIQLDDLSWILAGMGLPNLRELALCGRSTAELLERLRDARIVRQLDVLDVAGGYLGFEGLAWLQRNAAAFAHLRALHVPRVDPDEASKVGAFVVVDDRYLSTYE